MVLLHQVDLCPDLIVTKLVNFVMNDMSFQEKSLLQCVIFPYILGRERKYAV